jgi:hypothetical protein
MGNVSWTVPQHHTSSISQFHLSTFLFEINQIIIFNTPQAIYLFVNKGSNIQNLTLTIAELIFTFRTFSLWVVLIHRYERLRALTVALIRFTDLNQKDDKNGYFKQNTKIAVWLPKLYYLAGSVMIAKTCLFQAAIQIYMFYNGLATNDTFVLPAHTE